MNKHKPNEYTIQNALHMNIAIPNSNIRIIMMKKHLIKSDFVSASYLRIANSLLIYKHFSMVNAIYIDLKMENVEYAFVLPCISKRME